MPRMAAKGLTECWRAAFAAKPSDWKLMGVVCGPREVDPAIRNPEEWCAWARGPNKERLEGRGPAQRMRCRRSRCASRISERLGETPRHLVEIGRAHV